MPTGDYATVTGLPPGIEAVRDELTPMLSQYADCCAAHEDALVLFQVGDFYEAFCEAAEAVARICEVTLTQREDSTGEYPMAGIPIDNAASYLESLLDEGYRVAIADQIEDAEEAAGLVDRAVTEVITPGTVVDDELLDSGTTNYVAAVTRETEAGGSPGSDEVDRYGLAAVDVATGECLVTDGDRATIAEELDRVAPAELLTGPETNSFSPADADGGWMDSSMADDVFEYRSAVERLEPYVAAPDNRFGSEAELRAAGAVLAYAEYTQGDDGPLEYVARIRRYDPREHLRLDATAQRSLELFENRGLGASVTLFDTLDETSCALGRRCLERWLRRPLVDVDRIRSRHDAVAELATRSFTRDAIADHLSTAYDLERLVGRVSRGRANARDLRSLHATLAVVPEIHDALVPDDDAGSGDAEEPQCAHLADLADRLDTLTEIRDLLDRAVVVDPPQEVTEGGVIREGFDEKLDDLRATEREGREWIADLEARERERTGIDSLKVGHTQVHGYYIEVTDANLDSVPDDYHRRQTLKNAERYYTPELKEREDAIVAATERADTLEYELFTDVRDTVAEEVDRIQALADALAELDALCSLATVAVDRDYARPEIVEPVQRTDESNGEGARESNDDGGVAGENDGDHDAVADEDNDGAVADEDNDGAVAVEDNDGAVADDSGIHIEGGRHPVVERQGEFVPNDADLPPGSVAVITGPNMSGKSTYMRSVALAVVLAQIGSFVPAQAARLPVLDRVFTRVGASDDIAGGQSTFMREMSELTEILHDASPNSLVLLDEVGRGTSTADGRAIARAAVEFLHDELEATTLFATHYHDLTDLATERERVFNLHFTATKDDGDVTFLHRVARGAASSSYGVEVAELAGVPPSVVDRSRELVEKGAGDTAAGDGGSAATESPEPHQSIQSPDEADGLTDGRTDRSSEGATEESIEKTTEKTTEARGPEETEAPDATLEDFVAGDEPNDTVPADGAAEPAESTSIENEAPEVVAALQELELATMTPIEALNTLHDLQDDLT